MRKIARDHKEDLVGPAAKQVNKTEYAGIGEHRKWGIFHGADADGLEGPLKGVEHRDAGDRDQTQRFGGYVACGFGLHDVLSYRFASAGSIDYINARWRADPLIP